MERVHGITIQIRQPQTRLDCTFDVRERLKSYLDTLASDEARLTASIYDSIGKFDLDTLASDEARPLNIVFTYSIHIFRYASLRRGQTKYVATINVESLIQIRQPQTRLDISNHTPTTLIRHIQIRQPQTRLDMFAKKVIQKKEIQIRQPQTRLDLEMGTAAVTHIYLDTLASDEARHYFDNQSKKRISIQIRQPQTRLDI